MLLSQEAMELEWGQGEHARYALAFFIMHRRGLGGADKPVGGGGTGIIPCGNQTALWVGRQRDPGGHGGGHRGQSRPAVDGGPGPTGEGRGGRAGGKDEGLDKSRGLGSTRLSLQLRVREGTGSMRGGAGEG